jgi:hypothetical protein
MKVNFTLIGLVVSTALMLFAVPYSIVTYFDTSIPFDYTLFGIAVVSILLFAVNFYYYKYR